jgi:hypothetical protein
MIGLSLLLIGRQLFWIAIAGLGFILGLNYLTQFFPGSHETILLISLGIGALGAVLAYALQRTAATLLGFLAGWYLTVSLITFLDFTTDYTTVFAAIGGLLGVGLVSVLYDWSLIILSALSGTVLITQSMQFQGSIKVGIFVIMLLLGIAIQGFLMMQEGEEYR